MTARDRLVAISIVALVVLAGLWVKVVSPERSKVSTTQSKVETTKQQLAKAEEELRSARSAQKRYAEAYSSVVQLGKAVPADQEVPGLLYELDQASNSQGVEFASIAPKGGANPAAIGSPASGAKAQVAGFEAMPFTFTFNGSFANLYHLLTTVQSYAVATPTGELKINGRLLTIRGFKLAPGQGNETAAAAAKHIVVPGEHLTGTVTATGYVLPPGSEATGGATSSGPAGATGSGAQPASSSSSSGGAPAPATVKAAP
jgi:hypothetical protein